MKSLLINQSTTKHDTRFDALNNVVAQSPWQSQTVNELAFNKLNAEMIDELAPTLIELSKQERWIVLVGAPKQVLNSINKLANLNSAKVLLVHPEDQTDSLWAIEQALMSGNSSAVLGWPGEINSRDRKRLELASKRTSALAFLFTEQQKSTSFNLAFNGELTNKSTPANSFH
mgnify:CR=1 FL=1